VWLNGLGFTLVNKLISVSSKECHLSIGDRKNWKNWQELGLRITKTREEKKIDNLCMVEFKLIFIARLVSVNVRPMLLQQNIFAVL
jgi:hypothetical protein